jgi:hypothetical protein
VDIAEAAGRILQGIADLVGYAIFRAILIKIMHLGLKIQKLSHKNLLKN